MRERRSRRPASQDCSAWPGDQIRAFLFGFAGEIFGRHFERRVLLQAGLIAQENFEFVLAAFELENALRDEGFRELRAGDFDRQLEIFFFALLRDFENFVGAGLLFSQADRASGGP